MRPDRCNGTLPHGCRENTVDKYIGCLCHTDLCNGKEGWTTESLPPPSHKAVDPVMAEIDDLNTKLHRNLKRSRLGQPNSPALLKASNASDPPVRRPVMIVNTMTLLFIIFITTQLL